MGTSTILDTLLATPHSELIIAEYHRLMDEERSRIAEFLNSISENMKAEFINGEIVMHPPVMKRHWVASNKITSRLSLFVEENDLGIVGREKVMIDCSRNKYEPDIVFFKKDKGIPFIKNSYFFLHLILLLKSYLILPDKTITMLSFRIMQLMESLSTGLWTRKFKPSNNSSWKETAMN